MEKPDWIFGSEKKFYEFIKGLGGERVMIISHTDLDGIGAAKVINKVVGADDILFINYTDINDSLVEKVRAHKPKKVIISDLFFKPDSNIIEKIEKFAQVLIIDHHSADMDFNSDQTTHMLAQGFCAAYLSYYLLSKVQDISSIDWVAACASIADVAYKSARGFMDETASRYGDRFAILEDGQIRKEGLLWETSWALSLALIGAEPDYRRVFDMIGDDIAGLNQVHKLAEPVQRDYDASLKLIEMGKTAIDGGYFVEIHPKYRIGSLLTTDASFREQDKTWIFLSRQGSFYKFSARRQDGKVDLNILCSELVKGFDNASGGGHMRAAAGNFPIKYLPDFKRRLGLD